MVICFMTFPLDEVLQHPVPVIGQQRLRMELHAFDGQRTMTQPHNFTILRLRGHLETIGQRIAFYDQ